MFQVGSIVKHVPSQALGVLEEVLEAFLPDDTLYLALPSGEGIVVAASECEPVD